MKSEQEIRHKIDITCGMGVPANRYHEGFVQALEWVLGPMPPEKAVAFACPECGSSIVKIEPCSGYYRYFIDSSTGEVIYDNDDFNSQYTDDPLYKCGRCRWRADGRWIDFYEKERLRDEEDSDGQD